MPAIVEFIACGLTSMCCFYGYKKCLASSDDSKVHPHEEMCRKMTPHELEVYQMHMVTYGKH